MKVRVQNDVVVEILQPIPGFSIEQSFHPDLLATCFDADSTVQAGWIHNGDGTFRHPDDPAPEPAPAPVVVEEPEPDTPSPMFTPPATIEPPVEGT